NNLNKYLKCLKNCAAADHSAQLVGIADTLGDPYFGQSATCQLSSAIFRPSFFRSFQPLYSFLPSSWFKKDVSNSATQESIMNVHNKTQLPQARINCVPKDSSCDTTLPKILKLAILASNASSNSTRVFELPHTKDDSISTHKGLII
ncbi:hypothetical protein H5410_002899, partial [Solanum commersonii]